MVSLFTVYCTGFQVQMPVTDPRLESVAHTEQPAVAVQEERPATTDQTPETDKTPE